MNNSHEATNPFDKIVDRLRNEGWSENEAILRAIEDYLDGKPRISGKRKITRAERDAAFWNSTLANNLPIERWDDPVCILVLTRYFEQDRTANDDLIQRLALEASGVVCTAARQSGIVLRANSQRRRDLNRLASSSSEIAEFCAILDIFEKAHHDRCMAFEAARDKLKDLTPFELLIYASLFALAELVPQRFLPRASATAPSEQGAWDAINDLMIWKLANTAEANTHLTECAIGESSARHLTPLLFPDRSGAPPQLETLSAFANAIACQMELNSFISRSADAFSFDRSIRFVRHGDALSIEVIAPELNAVWVRDGEKLEKLHGYWFNRAIDEFVRSGLAQKTIGRPENHDDNRLAYLKAIRTRLRLTEVYGVGETVQSESSHETDLFTALLSLELMSAFFQRDFLMAYAQDLDESGDWLGALGRLAFKGLADGMQNRFPLTWSDRDAKVKRIKGWTVSETHPKGDPRMAAAVLDFWTSDWGALGKRLREGGSGLEPELFERPVIKMGQQLIQLPWIVGLQNNSSAAINNLRRLGARHSDRQVETRRIEQRLGVLFESRGFGVISNWDPPKNDGVDPGEIDLICSRDDMVLVIELKSTYLRQSMCDAWRHQTTTLRRAGQQLRDKVACVGRELSSSNAFRESLGLSAHSTHIPIHGWIVDTSIECDHMRFNGFLKISLEEVLIALRDDPGLLGKMDEIIGKDIDGQEPNPPVVDVMPTLYPNGFNANKFIAVIEDGAIWG